MRLGALLVALVCGASVAAATPSLTVRRGRAIHVTIGGRTEEAVALKAAPGGWRFALAGTGKEGGTLVLRDVTLGASGPRTFELPLAADMLLDDARFRPDHAYRVELRRGTVVVGSALIYLSPNRQRGPVIFDDHDASGPAPADDELRASDKGTL
jgi:hypothetical protein